MATTPSPLPPLTLPLGLVHIPHLQTPIGELLSLCAPSVRKCGCGAGEWGSGDDRRLLRALLKTGAAEDFQVHWGQLVATRTAQQARRRWRLMLKCVKDSKDREFSENLKTLVTTFTPDLLLPSPSKPAKPARISKKSKAKEVADSAAGDYPGMSGGMY